MTRIEVADMLQSGSSSPVYAAPERDPVYENVMKLRQPEVLTALLEAAWARTGWRAAPRLLQACVLQTHYKPRSRARLVAQLTLSPDVGGAGATKQYLYLAVFAGLKTARLRFAKALLKPRLACLYPAVAMLDETDTIVWSLPNGPRLRQANTFFETGKFAEFLADVIPDSEPSSTLPDLVRYVPRKRALFRYMPARGSALYIKVYMKGQDEIAARNLLALERAAASGALDFQPPPMVAQAAPHRAVVMAEIPGARLTELPDSTGAETFAAVGRALASLHASALEPTVSWTPEIELGAAHAASADLEIALPKVAGDLASLLRRLEVRRGGLFFEKRRPIHGNLFGDQILVAGDRVGIVDWDDLCLGDPLYDVGRLIAHLIFVAQQTELAPQQAVFRIAAMLDAYAAATGRAIAWDRLRWHVAVALLMRAKISALRPLPLEWAEAVARSLVEAERILDDRSEWLPVPLNRDPPR